jgi:hypothetical protein
VTAIGDSKRKKTVISFKKQLVETLSELHANKPKINVAHIDMGEMRKSGQWPAATGLYFALATRVVARREGAGYVLLRAPDVIFEADQFVLIVLKYCNGFNTSPEIKALVAKSMQAEGLPHNKEPQVLEEQIERTLTSLASLGLIVWIPYTQVHLDRRVPTQT